MDNLDVIEETLNVDQVKSENTPNLDDNSQSLVKDFFVKETSTATKELANLFGQSEFELQKEFGSYKAKKIHTKLGMFLDARALTRDEIFASLKILSKYGFYGVAVSPFCLPLVKHALKGSKVKVRALIGYPYGLETYKTLKCSIKQALEKGADEILLSLSSYEIKNCESKETLKKIKKLKKLARKKPLIISLDGDTLSLTELDGVIASLVDAGINGVSVNTAGVDKNLIESVILSSGGKISVELISDICSAEDAVSILLGGINLLTTPKCEQVATDLSKKINTVGCQPAETLDNTP